MIYLPGVLVPNFVTVKRFITSFTRLLMSYEIEYSKTGISWFYWFSIRTVIIWHDAVLLNKMKGKTLNTVPDKPGTALSVLRFACCSTLWKHTNRIINDLTSTIKGAPARDLSSFNGASMISVITRGTNM